MSTRKGAPKKKAPKHQNNYTFQHNKNSKKTKKILEIPNNGLCKRCYEKIEWKKKYRKYKPIKQPRKCNVCEQKKVTRAYHSICDDCGSELGVCLKCMNLEVFKSEKEIEEEMLQEEEDVEEMLEGLPLRVKKSYLRKKEKGLLDKKEDEEDEEEEGDDEEEGENQEEDEENDENEGQEEDKENDYEQVSQEEDQEEKEGDEEEEDEADEEESEEEEETKKKPIFRKKMNISSSKQKSKTKKPEIEVNTGDFELKSKLDQMGDIDKLLLNSLKNIKLTQKAIKENKPLPIQPKKDVEPKDNGFGASEFNFEVSSEFKVEKESKFEFDPNKKFYF